MPKLATLRQGVEQGLFPGFAPLDSPFWADGRNVIFRANEVRKMPGWVQLGSTALAAPIRGMGQLRDQVSGTQYLFYGYPTSLYAWNTVSSSLKGSGYTGQVDETVLADADLWSFAPWGRWMIATNGKDVPQILKLTDATPVFAPLAGVTFSKARIMVSRANHMLAFNTSNGANWMEWSNADDVETWVPTTVNSAGNLVLRDLESEIRAVVRLGDRLAVYGSDSMALVTFLGSPFYFGINPAVNGIGAVGTNSVVAVGRRNYGLSKQGVFVTDGSQFDYIDDPAIRQWLRGRLNLNQLSKIVSYHDEANTQVVWYYPQGNGLEPSEGIGYDYQRKAWTIYDFGRSAAIERQVFSFPIAGGTGGEIFAHDSGTDASGQALVPWVQSKPFDLGEPDLWKYIDQIKAEATGTGLQIKLGFQERLDGAITWTTLASLGTGTVPIDVGLTGRFVTLYLTSTAVGQDWGFNGAEVLGAIAGRDA